MVQAEAIRLLWRGEIVRSSGEAIERISTGYERWHDRCVITRVTAPRDSGFVVKDLLT